MKTPELTLSSEEADLVGILVWHRNQEPVQVLQDALARGLYAIAEDMGLNDGISELGTDRRCDTRRGGLAEGGTVATEEGTGAD